MSKYCEKCGKLLKRTDYPPYISGYNGDTGEAIWEKGYSTYRCPEHEQYYKAGSYGGGFGTPCFIATAAYGTELDPRLDILRAFRDQVLIPNPLGKAFVDFYYKVSPPIADLIRPHEKVRAFIRALLKPIVDYVEKKVDLK